MPKGLLNVVVGAGSEIGDAIVTHDIPSFVSFTGSTAVGKHIGELANGGDTIKPVALELGGNNPFVVLADADLDNAVKAAVFGKFLHQGQICIAINRIIVEDAIYDEFVERFVEHVKTIKVGDPNDGIRAGMTHVNDITVNDESVVPFGGEKNSGIGRFNGEWVLEEMTRLHWVSYQHKPRDYSF